MHAVVLQGWRTRSSVSIKTPAPIARVILAAYAIRIGEQLKAAWLLRRGVIDSIHQEDTPPDDETLYIPTLEDLIETSSPEFVMLLNFRRQILRTDPQNGPARIAEYHDDLPEGEWIADNTRLEEKGEER